jgi:chromosome segregation ATPase
VRLSSLRPPGTGTPQEQIPTGPLPLAAGQRWDAVGQREEREDDLSLRLDETEEVQETTESRMLELEPQLAESQEARRAAEARLAERERAMAESEQARGAAEARVAMLERELADLRGRMSYEREAASHAISAASGGGAAEIALLRAELAEAHEIIRAIEEAYLAGERRWGDGSPG